MLIVMRQISLVDGTLSYSDLLTWMCSLAAMYAEAAERCQQAQDQGFTYLKELFADLKI
jgi:hypothetical protein